MHRFHKLSAYMLNHRKTNAMIAVKGARGLVNWLLSAIHVIGLPVTHARVRAIVSLLRKLNKIYRTQGAKGLTLYLKSCAVMLQQALGGFVVKDLGRLGPRVSRTNRGVPRIINRVHRSLLMSDPRLIRLYLTVFNLYRLLEYPGTLSLNTITDPLPSNVGKGRYQTVMKELREFIPIFFQMLRDNHNISGETFRKFVMTKHAHLSLFPLLKSSPNTGVLNSTHGAVSVPDVATLSRILSNSSQDRLVSSNDSGEFTTNISTHPLAVYNSVYSLFRDPELKGPANYFLSLVHKANPLHEVVRRIQLLRRDESKLGLFPIWTRNLGKLSIKEEAAGKLRVFAMVDCFTQWVLNPLHAGIFYGVLSKIPQDGTFDQHGPIRAMFDDGTDGIKPKGLFSFDIKAATDRIPLELQQALLAHPLGEEYAQNWADFLTKRSYWLKNLDYHPKSRAYRYTIGQPMGALSSWASLAFVHHMIVQFSAYRVYGTLRWFNNYAILGDDIVIGDPLVAREYLKTMARLGVVIGLPKSIISREGTALEFAKRTYYKGEDVSPVPIKEMAAAFSSPAALVAFKTKYGLGFERLVKVLGFGYNVRGRLNKPFATYNGKLRMVTLAINAPLTSEDAKTFFELSAPKTFKGFSELKEVINVLINTELTVMKRKLNLIRFNGYSLERAEYAARQLAQVIMAQTNTAIINENSRNPAEPMQLAELKFVLPLVRQILYSIQLDPKRTLLVEAENISSRLINLMLMRTDMNFFDLYMQFIELQKALGALPTASLGFTRLLVDDQGGLTDTVHIRLWRRLAKYMFAKTPVPVRDTGFGIAGPNEVAAIERENLSEVQTRLRDSPRDVPPHLGANTRTDNEPSDS